MLSQAKWCLFAIALFVPLVIYGVSYYQPMTMKRMDGSKMFQVSDEVYAFPDLTFNKSLSNHRKVTNHPSERRSTAIDRQHIHHNPYLYKVIYPPLAYLCSTDTHLFITVITSPRNAEARSVLRQTILSDVVNNSKISYIFLIGYSSDETLQQTVLSEAKQHTDMVIGNFEDSYENLTIKSVFMLRFAPTFCPHAKFYFKLDDDVYANIPQILKNIQTVSQKTIVGVVYHHTIPIHDKTNKWYVNSFNDNFFPDYVSGTAYLISSDIMKPLYEQALQEPFLRLEDVFVTGICATNMNLKISLKNMAGFVVIYKTRPLQPAHFQKYLTLHSLKPNEILQGWKISHT